MLISLIAYKMMLCQKIAATVIMEISRMEAVLKLYIEESFLSGEEEELGQLNYE